MFADHFSQQERDILNQVAQQYQLDAAETKLLFIIRRIENGGPGKQMGVELLEAQMYKGDDAKSLKLQAEYAARTIQKRFVKNNITAFAQRWCPANWQNWLRMAKSMMRQA